MLSEDQIGLVEQSFDMVRPMAHQCAGHFYARLFEMRPDIAPLFEGANMTSQGHRMMGALGLLVRSLRDGELLEAAAGELGARHAGYGVRPEHYPPVGEALIWAMAQGLGPAFDDETRAAWAAAYSHLTGIMTRSSVSDGARAAE